MGEQPFEELLEFRVSQSLCLPVIHAKKLPRSRPRRNDFKVGQRVLACLGKREMNGLSPLGNGQAGRPPYF